MCHRCWAEPSADVQACRREMFGRLGVGRQATRSLIAERYAWAQGAASLDACDVAWAEPGGCVATRVGPRRARGDGGEAERTVQRADGIDVDIFRPQFAFYLAKIQLKYLVYILYFGGP